MPQEIKMRPAKHGALEPFEVVDMAFDRAIQGTVTVLGARCSWCAMACPVQPCRRNAQICAWRASRRLRLWAAWSCA